MFEQFRSHIKKFHFLKMYKDLRNETKCLGGLVVRLKFWCLQELQKNERVTDFETETCQTFICTCALLAREACNTFTPLQVCKCPYENSLIYTFSHFIYTCNE